MILVQPTPRRSGRCTSPMIERVADSCLRSFHFAMQKVRIKSAELIEAGGAALKRLAPFPTCKSSQLWGWKSMPVPTRSQKHLLPSHARLPKWLCDCQLDKP